MPNYFDSIQQQRDERNKHMTADPLNWLALCGRFILDEGESTFGSDPANAVVLPGFPAARTGVLTIADGKVSLTAHIEGVAINGATPEPRPLRTDLDGEQDTIEAGPIRIRFITRGGRLVLRAWDMESQAVKDFKGLHYYPIKPEFIIKAKYTPYNPPLQRKTINAIGNELDSVFVGYVEFSVDGIPCRLDCEDVGEQLLLNFTDATRADATYPGGRYIAIAKPSGSEVELDFNQAENWPCAYTNFATCPLPPFENRLAARIEAGELRFHD